MRRTITTCFFILLATSALGVVIRPQGINNTTGKPANTQPTTDSLIAAGMTLKSRASNPDTSTTLWANTGASSYLYYGSSWIAEAVTLDSSVSGVMSITGQKIDIDNQTDNKVLAAPADGKTGAPEFRALVAADLPSGLDADTLDTYHATSFEQKKYATLTVAKSGGDYTTIQAAIDAAPAPTTPTLIVVFPGTYQEKILIEDNDITIAGTDVNTCIIQFPHYEEGIGSIGKGDATVQSYYALRTRVENLTIINNGAYDESKHGITPALVFTGGSGSGCNCIVRGNGGRDILTVFYGSTVILENLQLTQYNTGSTSSHTLWVDSSNLTWTGGRYEQLGTGSGMQISGGTGTIRLRNLAFYMASNSYPLYDIVCSTFEAVSCVAETEVSWPPIAYTVSTSRVSGNYGFGPLSVSDGLTVVGDGATITDGGLTVTAGGVGVSSGGISIVGDSTLVGTNAVNHDDASTGLIVVAGSGGSVSPGELEYGGAGGTIAVTAGSGGNTGGAAMTGGSGGTIYIRAGGGGTSSGAGGIGGSGGDIRLSPGAGGSGGPGGSNGATGAVYVDGSLLATYLFGDGSSLTGINADTLDASHAAAFVEVAGDTMTGDLTMSDTKFVGLGSSAGRVVYAANSASTDTVTISDADLYVASTKIVSKTGIIDNGAFSAYSDLSAESKIGTGETQVAAGNHSHGSYSASITYVADFCEDTVVLTYKVKYGTLTVSNGLITANSVGDWTVPNTPECPGE